MGSEHNFAGGFAPIMGDNILYLFYNFVALKAIIDVNIKDM